MNSATEGGLEQCSPESGVMQRLDLLKTVSLFHEIAPEYLEVLVAQMECLQFADSQVIFEQGEAGHLLYILLSGRVRIHLGDLTLAEFEPGSAFGEMAVFDAQPRSASVTAVEASECLVLSRSQIYDLIYRNPAVAIALIQGLGRRLRQVIKLFHPVVEMPQRR